MYKKIILIVVAVILLALGGRGFWAYQQMKAEEARINNTPIFVPISTTGPVQDISPNSTVLAPETAVLSAGDLKAKEDLVDVLSKLTESINVKCGVNSQNTQCDPARKIVKVLTEKCLPLTKDEEIISCVHEFGVSVALPPPSTTSSSAKTDIAIALASTAVLDKAGVTNLSVKAGDRVYSYWKSVNADEVYLGLAFTKCVDASLNKESPIKKVALEGYESSDIVTTALKGCTIAIKVVAKNIASGKQASAVNMVAVN